MNGPLILADLMADPGELIVSCLKCHHYLPGGEPHPVEHSVRRENRL
jgi:hypothetical protein